MKCSVLQRCLIVGIGLILIQGCSSSRSNLARNSRNSSDAALSVADELADGNTNPIKTADAELANDDAPPSQPGAKSAGRGQNKLTSWMKKKDPKRESIPLDRTDSAAQKAADESLAEDDGGFWKQSDTPNSADNLQARKSKGSAIDRTNPFDP